MQQESFHINIPKLSTPRANIFKEYVPQWTAVTWFTVFFPHFPKLFTFNLFKGWGLVYISGKTQYFGWSSNVGIKMHFGILTLLITLPKPGTPMHAKCCLWETAWGMISPTLFLKEGYWVYGFYTQIVVDEKTAQFLTRCFMSYIYSAVQ